TCRLRVRRPPTPPTTSTPSSWSPTSTSPVVTSRTRSCASSTWSSARARTTATAFESTYSTCSPWSASPTPVWHWRVDRSPRPCSDPGGSAPLRVGLARGLAVGRQRSVGEGLEQFDRRQGGLLAGRLEVAPVDRGDLAALQHHRVDHLGVHDAQVEHEQA